MRCAPSSPGTGGTDLLIEATEARTVRLGPGLTKFRPGEGLSATKRAELAAAIDAIDRGLSRTASPEEIEEAFFQLDAVRVSARDCDTERTVRAWLGLCIDLPAAAFAAAIGAILKGEAKGVPPRFMPTLDQVCAEARAQAERMALQRGRLARLLAMEEASPVPTERQLTPAERAALEAKLATIRRRGREAFAGPDAPRRREGPSPAASVAAECAGRRAAREMGR